MSSFWFVKTRERKIAMDFVFVILISTLWRYCRTNKKVCDIHVKIFKLKNGQRRSEVNPQIRTFPKVKKKLFKRGLRGDDCIICKHCMRENLKWHAMVPLWGVELVGKLQRKSIKAFLPKHQKNRDLPEKKSRVRKIAIPRKSPQVRTHSVVL